MTFGLQGNRRAGVRLGYGGAREWLTGQTGRTRATTLSLVLNALRAAGGERNTGEAALPCICAVLFRRKGAVSLPGARPQLSPRLELQEERTDFPHHQVQLLEGQESLRQT